MSDTRTLRIELKAEKSAQVERSLNRQGQKAKNLAQAQEVKEALRYAE